MRSITFLESIETHSWGGGGHHRRGVVWIMTFSLRRICVLHKRLEQLILPGVVLGVKLI